MARGTYEATLTNVLLVRLKDDAGWGLLLRGTLQNGRSAFQFNKLSKDMTDPWAGADRAVRRIAGRMGVPADPDGLMLGLEEAVGGPVLARVSDTPIGARAVFSRTEAW